MKLPDITSIIRDDKRDITFKIIAYRTLTHSEKLFAVRSFLAYKIKPKLKTGSTITIFTSIGHAAPGA